jgi:hypothetical protein
MSSSTAEPATTLSTDAPKSPDARARRVLLIGLGFAVVVALGGWGTAGYLYFVALPDVATAHKVAYALELVDRFGDSPAHQVYMQLADDMKPWWDQIDEMQRKIATATDDDVREKLIAQRDETLVTFIHEHYLSNRIDMLITSFGQFNRCLDIGACDEDALRKSISIDVKRIYRTFRPYIEAVRASNEPGREYFGRDLEDLFFRFVG